MNSLLLDMVPHGELIMESAITGFERVIRKVRAGEIPLNRPGISSKTSRRAKKLAGKRTWFLVKDKEQNEDQVKKFSKKGQIRKGRPIPRVMETVMFVPATPGGLLR